MNQKNKPEVISQLRVPKAKNKLGLKVPTIAMPHDDLIRAEKPHLEVVPPTLTRQTSMSSQTSVSVADGNIAPAKNYQKVPNSITKQAIPEGLFVGKSKQLYDVLYGLTRGAMSPKRKIRVSKNRLMKQSGIGSRITFDACVARLQAVGLLRLNILPGEHEGNEFEILLPEELSTLTSQSSQSSLTTLTDSAQKLGRLVSLETSQSSQSLNAIESSAYEISKTSLKTTTKNDDDARRGIAFSALVKRLDAAVEKLTGKGVSENETEKWGMLADLLILEMETAARRTDSISSMPAFLTEVLRRKLFGGNSRTFAKSPKAESDTVGKPNAAGEYEKKPLDVAGREAALLELQDFADEEFLADFEKWYTVEDWQWLTEQLGKLDESIS